MRFDSMPFSQMVSISFNIFLKTKMYFIEIIFFATICVNTNVKIILNRISNNQSKADCFE